MNDDAITHVRQYGGLLEIPEKKALHWLARKMPRWINSDHLTLLGLASMIAAGAGYWMASRNKYALILVVAALAANWLGDSLDGTLARVRNCQRPRYGYYVDHVIDLFGTAALLGGLAFSGYMSRPIAFALLAAFALVEAEVFLATHVQQIFRLSCFRIGPTELRIILSLGTLYLLYDPWVHVGDRGPVLLFDIGGIFAIAGLLAAMMYSAIRNTRALYRAETVSG
ncbi:MAG: CDP-alcohol phosphatidyltransferase [Acidobacteria bacterium]|jgi:phosphatidylglycerophosphate synthase|nr:CDP-alcohol phosphatidyltransferase [Acidobacteriota bacterium]